MDQTSELENCGSWGVLRLQFCQVAWSNRGLRPCRANAWDPMVSIVWPSNCLAALDSVQDAPFTPTSPPALAHAFAAVCRGGMLAH